MAEFDVTVRQPTLPSDRRGPLIHIDLGYLDGGDHSPDIRDWRNLEPERAKKLAYDLLRAYVEAT